MRVDYAAIDGELKPVVLYSILTDDYGRQAAVTRSDWADDEGSWFEYFISNDTLHFIHRAIGE